MPPAPSDDPAGWDVPAGTWTPTVSAPEFLIPSDALPIPTSVSNNNVSVLVAGDTTFLAWRTAPTHFASADAELHVIASRDGGPWEHEHTIAVGADVREPSLVSFEGTLSLSFFELGTNPGAFEPKRVWRSERCRAGEWTDAVIEDAPRVPWDVKVRGGELLRTSYTGDHYQPDPVLEVHFERSPDGGTTWTPVGDEPVYTGGNSEVAFELDADGALWAVTRNEDGDDTGQGSMVCTAPADATGVWDCPAVSDPQRYDSPELFRHGEDLYLVARRDIGGAFGEDEGLLPYSARPKTTALYRLDRDERRVVHLFDLPGAGDTAFPAVWRTGPHTWRLANYTSPLDEPDISWFQGQTSPRGTQIYLATIEFFEDGA